MREVNATTQTEQVPIAHSNRRTIALGSSSIRFRPAKNCVRFFHGEIFGEISSRTQIRSYVGIVRVQHKAWRFTGL